MRNTAGKNSNKTPDKARKLPAASVPQALTEAVDAWPRLQGVLMVPQSETEYDRAVEMLNRLLDDGAADENHPLASLVHLLGVCMEEYEKKYHPLPEGSAVECIKHLMEEHELTQKDLPEVGNQSLVSQILTGKRKLNLRQVKALSERFHVSVSVFID